MPARGVKDASLLALSLEKGAMPQGIEATSRSRKKLGNQFSLRASKKEHALLTSLF